MLVNIFKLFIVVCFGTLPQSATASSDLRGGRQHRYSLNQYNTKCVEIPQNLTLCHNIGYNKMRLPNLLEHEDLGEVSQQAVFWGPLVASKCHSNARVFLCSLFAPVCLDQPVYPCRSLCESVKSGCEPGMLKYGFPWPDMLRCQQFPSDNQLCIGQINMSEDVDGAPESQGGGVDLPAVDPAYHGKFMGPGNSESKHHSSRKQRVKMAEKNGGKSSGKAQHNKNVRKKNGTAGKETLKREDVIRTLELICKADFVAKIEPISIHKQDASTSRITSKKVIFYKSDQGVLQTAKAHPSDLGSPNHHRYHFYTADSLLAQLFLKSSHSFSGGDPSSNGELNGLSSSAFVSSKNSGGDAEAENYKIHKHDELLVAGNRTTGLGKHSMLTLTLMMHYDVGNRLVKKVVKMLKEGSNFCSESTSLSDPMTGNKKLEGYISSKKKNNFKEDGSLKKNHESEIRKRRKNQRKDADQAMDDGHNFIGKKHKKNKDNFGSDWAREKTFGSKRKHQSSITPPPAAAAAGAATTQTTPAEAASTPTAPGKKGRGHHKGQQSSSRRRHGNDE